MSKELPAFIRSSPYASANTNVPRYVEKRWVPGDGKIKPPLKSKEEITSPCSSRPGTGDSCGGRTSSHPLYKEKKGFSTSWKAGARLSAGESLEGNQRQEDHATNRQQRQHQEMKEKHQPSMDLSASDMKIVKHESPTEPPQVFILLFLAPHLLSCFFSSQHPPLMLACSNSKHDHM